MNSRFRVTSDQVHSRDIYHHEQSVDLIEIKDLPLQYFLCRAWFPPNPREARNAH